MSTGRRVRLAEAERKDPEAGERGARVGLRAEVRRQEVVGLGWGTAIAAVAETGFVVAQEERWLQMSMSWMFLHWMGRRKCHQIF
jgi:hypothetical protein